MAWGWTRTRFLVGLLVACNLVAFLAIGALTTRGLDALRADEALDSTLVQAQELGQQYRTANISQVTALRDFLISGEKVFLTEQNEAAARRQQVAKALLALPDAELRTLTQKAEATGKAFDAYRHRSEVMKASGAGGLEVVAFLREGRDLMTQWRMDQANLVQAIQDRQETRKEHWDEVVTNYRRLAVAATSAALLVALALALTLFTRVLRPMRALETAAKSIAQGELGVRVAVVGTDEFGQVGQAFNTMAEEVGASMTRLRNANEELRTLDKAKDEFLSVTSHELRTPLGFIKGFAGLLVTQMAGPLEGEQREYVGHIVSNADRMLMLVNDLLDLATIRAGKLGLNTTPEPLGKLLEEAVAVARPSAAQKLLALELQLPGLAIAEVDPARIHQILMNLLSNAIKFTPAGGRVVARLLPTEGGKAWRMEVEDTGPGVSPDEVSKLFQRFSQVDMGDTRSVGGSGLGLYISKALTEAHGGQMGFRPAQEGGSVFWVELPAELSGQEAPVLQLSPPRSWRGPEGGLEDLEKKKSG